MSTLAGPRLRVGARELAERFGTPLYVFDGARMDAEAAAFGAAWGPRATIAYSLKCNPLLGVVARLGAAGCAAEVASGFEYGIARRAGIPGSRIVFNGPMKSEAELRRALVEGATVVLDGPEQVRAASRLAGAAAPGARIGVRVSPPDAGPHERFGMHPRTVAAAARMLARTALPLTGLHAHLGAYQLGPPPATGPPIHAVTVRYPVPVERFAAAAARLRRLAESLGGIEWLDLGGGWPRAAEVEPYRRAVGEVVGAGRDGPELILEPGRALIRDAGWLLTRVVERRGRGELVVDAGITQVPCVLWKRSPVVAVAPRAGTLRPTDLFGPLCLQHDVIARAVPLPPLRPGDLVWVGQTGAYAIAQAAPFIQPRPAAVMVDGGVVTVLRARETADEALGPQAEPLLAGPELGAVRA